MTSVQIYILFGAILVFFLLLFLFIRSYQKHIQKLKLYVQSKGYTYYKGDSIGLKKALAPSMFYNFARKPSPYEIIDTGTGKLFKVTVGRRISYTYSIYIDFVDMPDLMISKRTMFSGVGLAYSPYAKYGFHEIFINGLSDNYIVFAKDETAVRKWLNNIALKLNSMMGDYCLEVSQRAFLCYNYKKRPKIKEIDNYISDCKAIRDVLRNHE